MRTNPDPTHTAPLAVPDDRYQRQRLFAGIGAAGQDRLRAARLLIVGCGALGTHAAEYLARAGVGRLRLVDRDLVEWSNLHRQVGFTEDDARRRLPKATALARHLGTINGDVVVEGLPASFDYTNALDLARGCDLLLDGSDNLPARFLLNDVSYRCEVPWIYAGAVGAESHVQFFSGRAGPCLRCQLPRAPAPGSLASCDTAGVIAPAAGVAASWQVAWALRYLCEGATDDLAGRKAVFSLWHPRARLVDVEPDPSCAVCARKRFAALDGESRERATVLCGRRAVQVVPAGRSAIDLAALAGRLAPLGRTELRDGVLRAAVTESCLVTVFSDGRAIFDGLTDPLEARSLYARFVGQ